jgi:L-lactate dehydrogenase complex protein LldF
MQSNSHNFKKNVKGALQDKELQIALAHVQEGFINKRALAVDKLAEFEQLREQAKQIRNHTLEHLDYYLERYEQAVTKLGGQVHWARDSKEACEIVLNICQQAEAKSVIKGKSMVSEEIGLNEVLEQSGMDVIESDLGEYILQLAEEPPSHIIAPAIHKTRDQISDLFVKHHAQYGFSERQTTVPNLVNEARAVLRKRFLEADVGITGGNFLVAETGSNIIVTNEGNGDLSCTLPKVHIVTSGIEKVVPTLDDATALLRLLGRSATGQEITSYTTFSSGPKRPEDLDGPEQYHVVLVDNVRSKMLADEFREMLRCIRCGACMNHCPVYGSVGGHVYGWVYPGPMGVVLSSMNLGLEETKDLANACTLNGRCAEVCPVKIPLPDLLRNLRRQQHEAKLNSLAVRYGLNIWAAIVKRPAIYAVMMRIAMPIMGALGRKRGRFRYFPLAGGWTAGRDLPAPQGSTFQSLYSKRTRQKT